MPHRAFDQPAREPFDRWGVDPDDVEVVAREIQLRGATIPAVIFLEASRGSTPLDGQAMLFFDPVIRGVFGGRPRARQNLLADDDGIERLIDRLEELYNEVGLDA